MWLELLLLSIVGYLLRKFLVPVEENPLDKIPGPPRKPIIGCAGEFIWTSQRELFLKVRKYKKIYGDRYLVKVLNRRILHLSNLKDVEIVLSSNKNITKSKPYSFLEAWLGTGLLLSSGAKWHRRRKILTPAFHFNILKNFSLVIEEKSRALVEKLMKFDQKEVNLLPVISDFTLFTICETAMGTQLDHDKSSATVQYKQAIMEIGSVFTTRLLRFWLHNDFIFKLFPIGKKFQNCLQQLHSFTHSVIKERKKNWRPGSDDFTATIERDIGSKKRLAMLDLLLEAESKGEIDVEGIREEVDTFMFEGHDTSAMALVMALMLIADHEEVQERIYEECRSVFGDSSRPASMSELAEMKYVEAVIKETLRLYPSVPFIGRTVTEDFMLDDLEVKKGTEVAVHIYDLHRRPELFPDPDAFKPERFLNRESMHPYAFIPFSAGPRNCIGQRFAMLEMKCVLSEICRNFRVEPKMRGARPDLIADLLIRTADPIYVKFIKRC